MDLVGPRYIKGDGRFYSLNVMDLNFRTCRFDRNRLIHIQFSCIPEPKVAIAP
jgi:hypothetical protein